MECRALLKNVGLFCLFTHAHNSNNSVVLLIRVFGSFGQGDLKKEKNAICADGTHSVLEEGRKDNVSRSRTTKKAGSLSSFGFCEQLRSP